MQAMCSKGAKLYLGLADKTSVKDLLHIQMESIAYVLSKEGTDIVEPPMTKQRVK